MLTLQDNERLHAIRAELHQICKRAGLSIINVCAYDWDGGTVTAHHFDGDHPDNIEREDREEGPRWDWTDSLGTAHCDIQWQEDRDDG